MIYLSNFVYFHLKDHLMKSEVLFRKDKAPCIVFDNKTVFIAQIFSQHKRRTVYLTGLNNSSKSDLFKPNSLYTKFQFITHSNDAVDVVSDNV